MKIVTAMLALTLAGCATPPIWTKPQATREDYTKDANECNYEALKHAGTPDLTSGVSMYANQQRTDQIATACMRVKGWNLTYR